MRKRRILHVVQSADGGGVVLTLELAREAVIRGAQVVVASPSPLRHTASEGVCVATVPLGLPRRALRIASLAHSADLVHVHGGRAGTWSLPALAARPSVITFHGLHLLRRPAGVAYRHAARQLVRLLTRAASAVICVSESEARELEAVGVSTQKLHVVPNAVRPAAAVSRRERATSRARLAIGADTYVVLLAGRLDPQKDPRAALEIASRLPDDSLLLVAGDGVLRHEVQSEAGPNVRLVGYRDVRPLLAASDVLLSTSRWEGLPLTVLEAMQAGIPVVASAVTGNVEALDGAGILVAVGDLEGFVAALNDLRSGDERARLGELGRERVQAKFSFDAMLAATTRVYEIVLCGPPW